MPDYLTRSKKPIELQKLINEAIHILVNFGIPIAGMTSRQLEKMSMAFMAVANVKQSQDWATVEGYQAEGNIRTLKTRQIIEYINQYFDEAISAGSYDDIRRKDLKLPVVAGIIIRSAGNPNAARNDPTRAYALAPEYAQLIRNFGNANWEIEVKTFINQETTLSQKIEQKRNIQAIPVILPSGQALNFTPGKHNELQKLVIEEFLPRFGYGAELLYVGDTANKFLFINQPQLDILQFFALAHGELPDILAYAATKNWLFLIEAVHSSGPISSLRLLELKKLTSACTADIIFVTAFLDRQTFRQFLPDIAWETEVWIAESPDHLIHFNGEKFLGPYHT